MDKMRADLDRIEARRIDRYTVNNRLHQKFFVEIRDIKHRAEANRVNLPPPHPLPPGNGLRRPMFPGTIPEAKRHCATAAANAPAAAHTSHAAATGASAQADPSLNMKVSATEAVASTSKSGQPADYNKVISELAEICEDEILNANLVPNMEDFVCTICFDDIKTGEGVTLRDCGHNFCKACLEGHIKFTEHVEIPCPFTDKDVKCEAKLLHREIKELVSPEDFEAFLRRSERLAESQAEDAYHCKTPNCRGWCLCEVNVTHFQCYVCRRVNCINCAAIHEDVDCQTYQATLELQGDDPTKLYLQRALQSGQAMRCPRCKIIITKNYGCDYIQCSMCHHDICWITKGSRWGPLGRGDMSGGCGCSPLRKCHPNCKGCH